MQLTVKTLKGEKFTIEVEESHTIAQVKDIIEQQKSELVAESMKLIHSGKVLKDSETIADCRIQPNAFLVVMISKKKKPAAEVPSKDVVDSKPAAAVESSNPETVSTAATASTTGTSNVAAPSTPAVVPSSSSAAASIPLAPPRNRTAPSSPQQQQQQQQQGDDNEEDHNVSFAASEQQDGTGTENDLSPEAISNLMAMGFPEAEVRACLGAAGGNPNLAVEFLMNGIPEQPVRMGGNSGAAAATAPASSGREAQGQEPLGQLRNHPQIDQLRQLVQSNPAMLQAVLTQIGQQQPELLQEITRHQELFLQIMNEPVGTTNGSGSNGVRSGRDAAATAAAAASSGGSMMEAPMGPGGLTADMMQGLGNPAQLAQMIDSMTPEQLQSMSAMMGLTPEQLRMTAQAISRMPPEELQNYMNMAMEAGMGDEEGMLGDITGQGRGGGGGGGGGSQYVTLTEEELAAVERLTAMGFDRMEVIQAYLACDKNEEVAANLLMDGGFGFGGFGDDDGMGGGHDDDDDDGDDMYD